MAGDLVYLFKKFSLLNKIVFSLLSLLSNTETS